VEGQGEHKRSCFFGGGVLQCPHESHVGRVGQQGVGGFQVGGDWDGLSSENALVNLESIGFHYPEICPNLASDLDLDNITLNGFFNSIREGGLGKQTNKQTNERTNKQVKAKP